MESDLTNNARFGRPHQPTLSDLIKRRALISKENREERMLCEHEIAKEFVSNAVLLLPVEIDEKDLKTFSDGTHIAKRGTIIQICKMGSIEGGEYYPAFTGWDELYKGTYPGHVLARMMTFDDFMHVIGDTDIGVVINPQGDFIAYDKDDLLNLREEQKLFGWNNARRTKHPRMVRGTQNRVRLYLRDGSKTADEAVAVGSVAVTTDTQALLSDTASVVTRTRTDLFWNSDGVWMVYVEAGFGEGTPVGLIEHNKETGRVVTKSLVENCPKTSFVYCEYLSDNGLGFKDYSKQSHPHRKLTAPLKRTLQRCALENTYLAGCRYRYSNENVAQEIGQARASAKARKLMVPITMLTLLVGALLMGKLRVTLWPEPFSYVGSAFFLLIAPVVGATGLHYLVQQRIASRIALKVVIDELPVRELTGHHEAHFSLRPKSVLYHDEEVKLVHPQHDITSVEETKSFAIVHLKGGQIIPIAKAAL